MLKMIWAQDMNGAIGFKNDLLFYVPEDLKQFSALTRGHIVLMGSRTWDSLPDKFKPLPGRLNVVLSSREVDVPDGVLVFPTFEDAQRAFEGDERDIWVIGGGRVYNALKQHMEMLHVTYVDVVAEQADTYAPRQDWIDENFNLAEASSLVSANGQAFKFVKYLRK